MHAATLPIPHPRLRRLLLAISLCLTLTIAATVVAEQVDVAPAEAVTVQCVAGLLGTGATFIGTALFPPASAVAFIIAGTSVVTDVIGLSSCQTGYLKQMLRNFYAARGMGTILLVKGYACNFQFRCYWTYYAGGGGSSGPW